MPYASKADAANWLKRWKAANPDKVKAAQRRHNKTAKRKSATLRARYGITLQQYLDYYKRQGGKCAICSKFQEMLHIDHNHTTGSFRGLLCGFCNRGLGMFYERKEFLEQAIQYLKTHASS
jgi:hypothetical protein